MRRLNLLTGEYLEQARFYTAAGKVAAAEAVIFLLAVFLVAVTMLSTRLMRAAVDRNAAELASPSYAEAESAHVLADEARRLDDIAGRYFANGNMDIGLLGAAAEPHEGIWLDVLEINGGERSVFVSGEAESAEALAGFTARLEASRLFREVNIAALESGEARLGFTVELKPAEAESETEAE